jgi:hypothetical protein
LRAASQVTNAQDPYGNFLELRYGPQTNPTNREQALKDFFNVGHIEGLRLIVSHLKGPEAKTIITNVAETLSKYRQTMSPAEKAELGTYFYSDTGHTQIHQATSCYLSQDAQFRSTTSPVIEELLTTLTVVKPSSP